MVNQFVFDPHDTEVIYAATTVGVFHSTDGGRLWSKRMAGMKEVRIVVTVTLDPDHPHILYAGTTGGAYRSEDGAKSWTKINTGLIPAEVLDAALALGVTMLGVDPRSTGTVYAATTKGLFKTLNRGESWTRIGQTLGDQYVSSLVVDPSRSGVVYAGGRAGVSKSANGGARWSAANTGLETLNIRTIAMRPLDPDTLYAGTNGSGLYRSTDGATTWTPVSLTLAPAEGRAHEADHVDDRPDSPWRNRLESLRTDHGRETRAPQCTG